MSCVRPLFSNGTVARDVWGELEGVVLCMHERCAKDAMNFSSIVSMRSTLSPTSAARDIAAGGDEAMHSHDSS